MTTVFTIKDSKGVHQDVIIRKEGEQIIIQASTGRLIIIPAATNRISISVES